MTPNNNERAKRRRETNKRNSQKKKVKSDKKKKLQKKCHTINHPNTGGVFTCCCSLFVCLVWSCLCRFCNDKRRPSTRGRVIRCRGVRQKRTFLSISIPILRCNRSAAQSICMKLWNQRLLWLSRLSPMPVPYYIISMERTVENTGLCCRVVVITSSSTNTEIPLRSARKRQDRDFPCLFKWSQPLLFQLCTAQWRHHVCERSSMSFFWTVSPWRAVVLWRRYIRPLISFVILSCRMVPVLSVP